MQNEQPLVSPEPQHKNKTLEMIKSQKNIISMDNLNAVSAHDDPNDHDDQDTRKHTHNQNLHTEVDKNAMRETFTKGPRMPNHKRLNPFMPGLGRQRTQPRDVVDNINKIVENSEYRYVQSILSPLPFVAPPPPNNSNSNPVGGINQDRSKKEKKKQSNKNPHKNHGNNHDGQTVESSDPRKPYFKYQDLADKIHKRLNQDIHNISMERFRRTHVSSSSYQPQFKMEELVLMSLIKGTQNTGAIQKMLHVPKLKFYILKEEPLLTKAIRNSIKQWLGQWQMKVSGQAEGADGVSPFIKIQQLFWESGSVGILQEYCEGGSLLNLLQFVGTLPENVIKQIAFKVAHALSIFYTQVDSSFGGLSPSQILFTDKGHVKLNLGLYYRNYNQNKDSSNVFSTCYQVIAKPNPLLLFQGSNNKDLFSKLNADPSSKQPSSYLELEKSLDIFKLGFIVFQCTVGSFQIYEQSGTLNENLRLLLKEDGQKAVEKDPTVCCVLHSEDFILSYTNEDKGFPGAGVGGSNTTKRQKHESGHLFRYITFLKNRFSPNLISFLCSCLKLSHKRRAKIGQLLVHPFVKNTQDPKSVKVSMVELLKISRGWCDEIPNLELVDRKIQKLIADIMTVLPNCRRESVEELRNLDKTKIAAIAKDLGVRDEVVYSRFQSLIKELESRQQ